MAATLFGRASNVLMVALAATTCGAAAFVRQGQWSAVMITLIEVMLLLARCATILAFQSSYKAGSIRSTDPWLLAFALAAVGSSICWGAFCFVSLAFSHDPVLYVLPVLATVGTAGAVAARNSGVPRLAKAQLVFSLFPIMAGSMLADDPGYRLLLILVPAMLAGLLILIAERNQQIVALIESQRELSLLSRTDPLTEVANRRHFSERLARAWSRTVRAGSPLSVLIVDVDHFKLFNDDHGHLAGDACLQSIARILSHGLRSDEDLIARYGGEEFAILLESCDLPAAKEAASRLCANVAAWGSPHGSRADGLGVVTISVGVASTTNGYDSAEALVRAADDALYCAKRLGRNRVEVERPHARSAAAA